MAKQISKETGEVLPVIHTWRNPRKVKALKCDEHIVQHYDFMYDPEIRALKVVEGSKEDREAYIQSFAADSGVYNVLKKYARTGDASILNQRQVIYADVSDIPEDNLDPAAAAKAADIALGNLNKSLGAELTAEQLASMSPEQLSELISKAVEAAAAKTQVKESDGKE